MKFLSVWRAVRLSVGIEEEADLIARGFRVQLGIRNPAPAAPQVELRGFPIASEGAARGTHPRVPDGWSYHGLSPSFSQIFKSFTNMFLHQPGIMLGTLELKLLIKAAKEGS